MAGPAPGTVAQADGLGWDELYALAAVTVSMLDWERHSGPGTWHPNCARVHGDLGASSDH